MIVVISHWFFLVKELFLNACYLLGIREIVGQFSQKYEKKV